MIIWKKSELRKTSQITIHFSSFCTLCIDGVRWLLQWLLLMMASGWALITHKTTYWYCEFNLIILISITHLIIGLEILRMIYKRNEYLIFNWAKLRFMWEWKKSFIFHLLTIFQNDFKHSSVFHLECYFQWRVPICIWSIRIFDFWCQKFENLHTAPSNSIMN